MTLYKNILYLVHTLIRLKLWLFCVWNKVIIMTKSMLGKCSILDGKLRDLSSICADGQRMKQIPTHIGLVVVEDTISCQDIAKIIVWSIGVGIPCVTLFDQKGEKKFSIFI